MVVKQKTVYVAFDGTEFNSETNCIAYEKKYLTDNISSDCIFLNATKHRLTAEEFLANPETVDGFYVPNEEQAKIISQILEEFDLESPWNDDTYTPGFYWYSNDDGTYVDVKSYLQFWQSIYDSFQKTAS